MPTDCPRSTSNAQIQHLVCPQYMFQLSLICDTSVLYCKIIQDHLNVGDSLHDRAERHYHPQSIEGYNVTHQRDVEENTGMGSPF